MTRAINLEVNTVSCIFPQPFPDFNGTPFEDTEKMIQFHIHAANIQLRQAYYGFVAALGLDRVLVMPRVRSLEAASLQSSCLFM